ncbi:hypothetical protein EDD86DRAFT_195777 [Gorgonomyces haynaldii]|nr:hypothetical protein EDD86DRAFT_195777 [Gorgonomyces haynaldii]
MIQSLWTAQPWPVIVRVLEPYLHFFKNLREKWGAKVSEETAHQIDSIIRSIMIISFLVLVGVPIVVVSSIYGYWLLVQWLIASLVLLSAFSTLAVNFFARLRRSFSVLWSLQKMGGNMNDNMRAVFVASVRFDRGDSIVQSLTRSVIVVGFWIVVGSLIFVNAQRSYPLLSFGLALMAGGFVFKIPYFRRKLDVYVSGSYIENNDKKFYNGKFWFPCLVLFFFYHALIIIGVVSLIYFEDNGLDFATIPSTRSGLVGAFLILHLLRDLLLIVPFEPLTVKRRVYIVLVIHVLEIIFAIQARVLAGGYVTTLTLVLCYISIDYRHPKALWTRGEPKAPTQNPGLRAVQYLLQSFIAIVLVALIIGFIRGSGYINPPQSDIKEVSSFNIKPQVCQMRIGNLSVYDMAILARSSYAPDPKLAREYYNWTQYPTLNSFTAGEGDDNPSRLTSFQEFNSGNLVVISVRGTKSVDDAFQDLYLYAASISLTASSHLGTLTSLWPTETVAYMVHLMGSIGRGGKTLSYYESVEERAKLRLKQNKQVILVGHSLGGAIVGIVGSRLNIPAVGFSAPGLGYQTIAYGFTEEQLQSNYVNIIPVRDLVPQVDLQMGLLQYVPCYAGQPLDCHKIARLITTLQSMCSF